MKLFKHLRDNRGDENVSKLIWVVIVFVVGAILLTTIFSAFKTPISGWYDNLVDSWFGEPAPEQRYSLGDDEVQNSYELTGEGIGATFLINGEPVDCYAAYDISKTEDDNVYAYFVDISDEVEDKYIIHIVGTGEMMDVEDVNYAVEYQQITEVIIEYGITHIGAYAFKDMSNATITTLPNSITTIGHYAFDNCHNLALTSLPEGITSIGSYAFNHCINLALTSLPQGITSIGQHTFSYCRLLALTSLPEGLTSIKTATFDNCTNLALTSLPQGLISIETSAFKNCTGLALTSLPKGITSIGSYAFSNCINLALTSLPDGITKIDGSAFSYCRLLTLTSLPEGITSIGSDAFNSCTSLPNEFTIPSTVTTIGYEAFKYVPHINYNGPATGSPWGAVSIN